LACPDDRRSGKGPGVNTLLPEWVHAHHHFLWGLSGVSILASLAGVILVPWLVGKIPADYFTTDQYKRDMWAHHHPVVRGILLFAKNLLGLLLILAGIAMLVLPGQGLLTILIGILLLNFPGKHHLVLWFVSRRPVLQGINWMRRRRGRDPLLMQ
jgi:hypothetical protein